ncbi:pyridoxal phosphate-dependent decarboxylase family protein [Burkholderia ubonensis]|uniref:pyridoxal phosphate-dependent decarboxylase family protein n=1 Tax=Burkholderia ubonensis TaxID=101571 RepID=UPI000AE17159|nr:pyridoxal-dependent decarboxylase [Burkholderia ubonensis]
MQKFTSLSNLENFAFQDNNQCKKNESQSSGMIVADAFDDREYLGSAGQYFDDYIEKLKYGFLCIQNRVGSGPKYKVEDFCYKTEIEQGLLEESGQTTAQVLSKLSQIVDGSIRPQSPFAAFNMVPNPMLDTIVAGSLMQLYNINAISDNYGGKSLLFEQQVARSIGKLAGWEEASGLSCNGGKVTLFYAIQSAISRIAPESAQEGLPNDLVILTPEGAHYSLEHTCSLLGLGKANCIRVPVSSADSMSVEWLRITLEEQIAKGKRVAAIIACGGTTLDFQLDNTQQVYEAVSDVVTAHQLNYMPYLHLDSVIGWLWLNYLPLSEADLQYAVSDPKIRLKIKVVMERLQGLKHFDSLGVDFHKNGLCPYASSFFVRKKLAITQRQDGSSMNYGELRAFGHTIENSRPSSGIASAWTALQRLGRQGLRHYLAGLLTSGELIKTSLAKREGLSILNESSLGWDVIFSIKASVTLEERYGASRLKEDFYRYAVERTNHGDNIPSISLIKDFRSQYGQNLGHGFIYYNMSPWITEDFAERIAATVHSVYLQYEKLVLSGCRVVVDDEIVAPIR